MCKVIIDTFETEQHAVAFILTLKNLLDNGLVSFTDLLGNDIAVEYDGVDNYSSTKDIKVVSITTWGIDNEPEED